VGAVETLVVAVCSFPQVQPEDVAVFVYRVAVLVGLSCFQRHVLVADRAARELLFLGTQAGMGRGRFEGITVSHLLHWNDSNRGARAESIIYLED